jgi:hypothetical protein
MKDVTGKEPRMWGPTIVGFGDLHYKSPSGREGDWFQIGFSPRKQALTLYLAFGLESFADLLAKLGKYSHGVGCVYVKGLSDVDLDILRAIIERAYEESEKPATV